MLTSSKRDGVKRVQHEETLDAHNGGQAMIHSTEWLLKKKNMSHLELECLAKPAPVNLSEERGNTRGSMDTNVSFCTFFIIHHLSECKKKNRKNKRKS